MLPELVVAPPDRRDRRRDHERRHHRAARPGDRATGRRSCATRSASPARACPAILPAGHPRRFVARRSRAPRRRSRHRIGGRSAAPEPVRHSCRRGPGCSSAASRNFPTPASPRRPPGSPTSKAHWAAIRFLRNVAGWWLVEECRRIWGDTDVDQLLAAAAAAPTTDVEVDVTDERFLAPDRHGRTNSGTRPDSMPTASRAIVVRTAVESMAAATASVVDALPRGDDHDVRGIRVFGGGSRSALFLDALQRRTPLPGLDRPGRGHRDRKRARAGDRVGCLRRRGRRRVRHWPTTRRSRR